MPEGTYWELKEVDWEDECWKRYEGNGLTPGPADEDDDDDEVPLISINVLAVEDDNGEPLVQFSYVCSHGDSPLSFWCIGKKEREEEDEDDDEEVSQAVEGLTEDERELLGIDLTEVEVCKLAIDPDSSQCPLAVLKLECRTRELKIMDVCSKRKLISDESEGRSPTPKRSKSTPS